MTSPDDLVDVLIEEVARIDKVILTSKARRALLNYFFSYGDRRASEMREAAAQCCEERGNNNHISMRYAQTVRALPLSTEPKSASTGRQDAI